MLGTDVYPILQSRGISRLHHANSVVTSNAFLHLGGLASRGQVERLGWPQTGQYTDSVDKRYGIWNDVFTDGIDIHERISNHNKYGPVVFVLDAKLLLDLPEGTDVLVTRANPSKWISGQSIQDRYFATVEELAAGLTRGTFDQMITFRTAEGIVPFGRRLEQIILDDPQARRANGSDAFTSALQSLQAIATASGIALSVTRRKCSFGCGCVKFYASNSSFVQGFF